MISHKEEWLTQILPRFEHDEVRVVLRATRTYGSLLSESFHPKRLRDALEGERLFNFLWNEVTYMPYLRQVIAAEREDLWQNDVPLFTTQPASRDLFTSQGKRIKEFCPQSGMTLVQRRIEEMSERDLALQQWIIRASLVTTIMGDALASEASELRRERDIKANREVSL